MTQRADWIAAISIPEGHDVIGRLMTAYLRSREDDNRRAWRSVARAVPGRDSLVMFDPEARTSSTCWAAFSPPPSAASTRGRIRSDRP